MTRITRVVLPILLGILSALLAASAIQDHPTLAATGYHRRRAGPLMDFVLERAHDRAQHQLPRHQQLPSSKASGLRARAVPPGVLPWTQSHTARITCISKAAGVASPKKAELREARTELKRIGTADEKRSTKETRKELQKQMEKVKALMKECDVADQQVAVEIAKCYPPGTKIPACHFC